MIISLNILKNSLERYNNSRNIRIEKYDKPKKNHNNSKSEHVESGFTSAFYVFLLIISMIFFLFELVLLYFAVFIAINCSKSREERIVNFILAVVFTLPYVSLNILFNPCAKEYLQNGMKRTIKE
jgi:uncharacterized protein YqhQ